MSACERDCSLDNQGGFTLIELLVYTALFLIVLVIAGGMLINGTRGQETVRSVTGAATVGQQVVRSVQAGVRNASEMALTADPVAGTQLLVIRTVGGDPDSTATSCQAWYYTPSDGGTVYTTRTSGAPIALPAGGPSGVWTLLGTGISPMDAATGKVLNAPAGGRVELRFTVEAGSHPYVLINTTIYAPQSTTGVSCSV
jgi:prepilin-type N-terminal cleavage/methylation domain